MKKKLITKKTKTRITKISKKNKKPQKVFSRVKIQKNEGKKKTKKEFPFNNKIEKSTKDLLIEILKEYNLSKNINTFEKKVKKIINEREVNKGKCFKTIFSKMLTKAYIKSKLTYDFTPKDLKFIKNIIDKVLPSSDKTIKTTNNLSSQTSKKDNLRLVSRYLARKLVFSYSLTQKKGLRMLTLLLKIWLLFVMV